MQAKLRVNGPGDACEVEADRIADLLTEEGEHVPCSAPLIQRYLEPAGEEWDIEPAVLYRTLAGPGRPLEPALREDMGQRLGYDFSDVRVHADAAAERSAADLDARAYTAGNHIVFGAGGFAPKTREGRRLLAHELTHVVQQAGQVAVQRAPAGSPDDFIIHADAMALVESKLLQLYEALPKAERVWLKQYGTVAIGLATQRRKPDGEPMLVYSTNSDSGSKAFHETAARLGLVLWSGDGPPPKSKGKSRHSATGPPPPGMGGSRHAEQNMISAADGGSYVIHGMAVSRTLCHDCPLVLAAYKGGKMMISVVKDPDGALPESPLKQQPAAAGAFVKPPSPEGMTQGGNSKSGTKGGIVEGRGGGIAPIMTPEPALASRQVRGAHEGLASMLVSAQLGSLRSAEMKKAIDAAVLLEPEIESYREKGLDVTVTLVVDLPRQPDVAAFATGVGNVGEVVRFKDMYIARIDGSAEFLAAAPSLPSTTPRMSAAPSARTFGGPAPPDPTLNQQIRMQMGDQYAVPGTGPRAGRRFVSIQHRFAAYPLRR